MNCNWECKKTEVNWMRWNVNLGHTKREREREKGKGEGEGNGKG